MHAIGDLGGGRTGPLMAVARSPSWSLLLVELTRAFSALISLDELLPTILRETKEAFRAESSSILLLDEASEELYIPVTTDVSPEVEARVRAASFPADRGIAGDVLRTGRGVFVPNASSDPRFYGEVDRKSGTETMNLMCAPLRTEHGTIGVIQVRNRAGTFSDADLELLNALSDSIAIALENSQQYERLRRSEARLREQVGVLRRERAQRERFAGIVGGSPAMRQVYALMESATSTEITVLVQGETGTGKEGIARAIHENGSRSDGPFIAVNCGALQETILESELFGVRKGAFTGAHSDRAGLFEAAHDGTLFLDEIGEMSPGMQVKLLRVLEEGEIRRVGDTHDRKVDLRVIAATNRDLAAEVKEGRFREDLFYRINVFPIQVPALRERREDIPALVTHFLGRSTASLKKEVDGIEPAALDCLVRYDWPGNVRQLENEIQRAVAIARSGEGITRDCLSEPLRTTARATRSLTPPRGSLREAVQAFERDHIRAALDGHAGSVTEAARALGVSRQLLHRRLKDLGIR
jgi:transcriptional regulator with GAF, ATPase, and Fis domain